MKSLRAFLPLTALLSGSLYLHAGPEPAPATSGNGRIPAGKGETTEAGKFVPSTGAAEGKLVKPEEAEKQLREALKVEELAPGKFCIGKVKFDAAARTISLPAKINMRSGVIEYVLTTEAGKAHEAMLTTTASPGDLHLAGLLLGMKGTALTGAAGEAMKLAPAESVRISVTWETNGPAKTLPLAALLSVAEGNPDGPKSPREDGPWHYTGSGFSPAGRFAAETEGSFISLIRDGAALVNNPDPTRDNDELHVPNTANLPAAGTPVTVILQLPAQP